MNIKSLIIIKQVGEPPKMSTLSITKNAVDLLVQEAEQQFVVQIINVKKMRTASRISCDISDGIYKIRAYITDQKITEDDDNAFILINSYGRLSQQETMVGIVVQVCQIIDHYTQTLGNPQDFLKKDSSFQTLNKQNVPLIKVQKLKSFQMKKAKSNSPVQKFMEKKKVPINQISEIPADCEKISELYPDLQNWEIIARLIKKSYREFISKGGRGKQTKVMNVELMDNTGVRITGAMFGEAAKQFYESLNEDIIYKVSKGQIREDQYNQNKGKNFSRYTIMLTRNSEFKSLSLSENLLSQYQTELTSISNICEDPQKNEEYDCVGILVQVHDEVQIPKQSKTLYKRLLIICDPQNEKIMEAIVWNRNLNIDTSFIGKTVGLYGFRLNNYNDSFSLNSSYHSDIRLIENHKYNKYEGTIEKEKIQFFSERKEKNIEIEEQCKNLKELQNQLIYLEAGKEIKSTMCLTLTLLSYKKWSYESCPYCRKSAEPHNKCNHCEKYIDDTIPRYKLNVELSDSCGSIWATGFEELGTKLFSDYNDGIKYVKSLEEGERHRLFEKKQFQEFTVKLTSKLDREGNVKHTVNRVYDINMTSKIVENINRIKGYI